MKLIEGPRQDKENHPPSQFHHNTPRPAHLPTGHHNGLEYYGKKSLPWHPNYREPLADITHLYVNNKVPLTGLGSRGHYNGHHDGENGE